MHIYSYFTRVSNLMDDLSYDNYRIPRLRSIFVTELHCFPLNMHLYSGSKVKIFYYTQKRYDPKLKQPGHFSQGNN